MTNPIRGGRSILIDFLSRGRTLLYQKFMKLNLNAGTDLNLRCLLYFSTKANFGNVSSTLTTSNGRAFAIGGDGLIEVSQFAMNNERNAGTHLWAASASSKLSLRIRGGIYNYTPDEDVVVAQNLDFGADGSRQEL